MNPLMRVYNFHKRDFKLGENKFLRLFEKLLSESPCSILEFAPKITPKGIHAARFRAGYVEKDNPIGLNAIFQFLDEISKYENVYLNRRILEQIVNKRFDLLRVRRLGIGVDFRESFSDSKVKCYFTIKDYPEKLNQVLAMHPPVDRINDYPINDMFGINIYFDGRTDIEIYPSLMPKDWRDETLMDKLRLQDVSREFLSECNAMFVSFEGNGKHVLHLYPHSPTRFVRMIGNRQLSVLYGNAQIIRYIISRSSGIEVLRVVISCAEDEMISNEIQHIDLALYYQLSQTAKS